MNIETYIHKMSHNNMQQVEAKTTATPPSPQVPQQHLHCLIS
jgi:hypothetical protein